MRLRIPDVTSSAVVTAVGVVFLWLMVRVVVFNPALLKPVIALTVLVCVTAVLGLERTGIVCMLGAFATAPVYSGIVPPGTTVTPTDMLLVLGGIGLLPKIVAGFRTPPLTYLIGVGLIIVAGLIASIGAQVPIMSIRALFLWLMMLVVLPVMIGAWKPPLKIIDALAWAYVAGQTFSLAYGLVHGPVYGRYLGFTNHPNSFAEGGMLAFAMCLYLLGRQRFRYLVYAGIAVSLVSVYLSGGRAATLGVLVMIALIPIVERSVFIGYVLASGGVLVGMAFTWLALRSAEGSALNRLIGNGNTESSNVAREEGVATGWEMFKARPLLGHGLDDISILAVHNMFLEAAVGIGVVGCIGFILILVVLGGGILSGHPQRRLCYTVVGAAIFGATSPSLYDRSSWIAVALAAVVAFEVFGPNKTENVFATSDEPAPAPQLVPTAVGWSTR